jgi:TolA-binding protein
MAIMSAGFLTAALALTCATAIAAPMPLLAPPKRQSLGKGLPEGEKAIYLRLVDSYRRADVAETYKFRDLMLKHYGNSVYADNAIYLTGLLDYQRGRIAEAVGNFGEIIDRYPKSNKRAAAMFAKSQAYTRLNLHQLANDLMKRVIEEYPGSPESQRATLDLRLKGRKG